MTCEQVGEGIYDFLLDLVEPDVRRDVEAHLRACDACGRTLDKARKSLSAMEQWDPKPPTARLRKPMTTRRALARRADPPWKSALALAGVFLVVMGLVVLLSPRRRPLDPDLLGQGSVRVDVPSTPPDKAEDRIVPPVPERRTNETAEPRAVLPVPQTDTPVAPKAPEPARGPDPVVPSPPPVKKAPVTPAEPRIDTPKTATAVAARVERVKGDVRIWSGSKGERRAAEGLEILPGERVVTQEKESAAALRLSASTQLNVAGTTEIQVTGSNEVYLARGVVDVDALKREGGSGLILATVNATVELQQARVMLERKDESTLLSVRQGTAQFTNLVTGKVFQAKPGQNAKAEGHPKVDQRKVDAAVANGVTFLRTKVAGLRGGTDELELVLYTLLHAGVPESDKDVQELLKYMLANEPQKTYNTALRAMILEKLGRVRFQEEIWKCAQFLVDNQGPNGQWGYGEPTKYGPIPKGVPTGARPDTASGGGRRAVDFSQTDRKPTMRIPVKKQRDGSPTDNSNSQYAALGLRACHDAGIELPKEVIERAKKWLVDVQFKEEGAADKGAVASGPQGAPPRGWGYGGPSGFPYGSMTAGAIGSICIYDYILDGEKALSWKRDKEVLSGLAWLAQNFSPTGNPNVDKAVGDKYSLIPDGAMYYYYLYAVERTGLLFGTEKFGAREWYPEGAAVLLKNQQADGSWPSADTHRKQTWDTSFAILFLRRATKPLNDVASEDSKGKK